MRAWSRGEKIGFWSMILGAITCLAVLSSIPPVQPFLAKMFPRPPAERTADGGEEVADAQLLLDEQRKLLSEQTQAVHQELRRVHDERIALRRQRIDSLAEKFTGEKREYDRILLRNQCDHVISIALYYLDLDSAWITRGWWGVEPGQTVTTDAMTRNAFVYFYAENQQVERVWDGTGKDNAISLPVVDDRFDHLAGEAFVYDSPHTVSFYQKKTEDAWGDHVEVFECYLEAPLPASESKATPEATKNQGGSPI